MIDCDDHAHQEAPKFRRSIVKKVTDCRQNQSFYRSVFVVREILYPS